MRALVTLALGLAFLAAPAHAEGRNTGAFHGSQGYQDGTASFSIDVVYAGPDGSDRLHCEFAGAADFDGTTERATLSGDCEGVPLGTPWFPDSELTYAKTGTQFSAHLEWTDGDVTWAAGLSGFAVARPELPELGVALAGTASVYIL